MDGKQKVSPGGGGKPEFGGPKGFKPKMGRPTSSSGGSFGFIGFVLLLIVLGAGIYLQIPKTPQDQVPVVPGSDAATDTTAKPSLQNAFSMFFRAVFPGLYGSSTLPLGASNTISEEQVPTGFVLEDLAPYFKQIRIIAFTADAPAGGEVVLQNGLNQGVGMAGWSIRGSLGSQIIGLEGENVGSELRLKLRRGVVLEAHDRIFLYDPRGKLVDAYSF
jgi:hypothetical protein